MKKKFITSWKESIQPRKQRKYIIQAPLHVKRKFLSAHLSKELLKKYSKRSVIVRKGDKIKVMRGSFKNHAGKVESVDIKSGLVRIAGIEFSKKDGSKIFPGIHASNILITELAIDDKKRKKSVERKNKGILPK
jgi:large subunit ribosomal protein L24